MKYVKTFAYAKYEYTLPVYKIHIEEEKRNVHDSIIQMICANVFVHTKFGYCVA